MNKQKLKDYVLTGGITELSLKVSGFIKIGKMDYISDTSYDKAKDESLISIDFEKYNGILLSLSEFKKTMEDITKECGIGDYKIVRTTFCLTNSNAIDSDAYKKLNGYIMEALCIAYDMDTSFYATDFFAVEPEGQVIKSRIFEVDNQYKNGKKKQPKLKLRTMSCGWRRIHFDVKSENNQNAEFLRSELEGEWTNRLDVALSNLEEAQKQHTEALEREWNSVKGAFPVRYTGLTAFVLWNQDVIFTKKQLIDLCKRIDESGSDPVMKAGNYKKRYGIEFFSRSDMQTAVAEIKRAIINFCEN